MADIDDLPPDPFGETTVVKPGDYAVIVLVDHVGRIRLRNELDREALLGVLVQVRDAVLLNSAGDPDAR